MTLLCIGPLTNIAALFAADEEIPSLLGALVLMCGRFTGHSTEHSAYEWNAQLDPHATAMVYAARPAVHRSVGLDVTQQVRMPADEVRRRFQASPLLRMTLDFAEVWFRDRDEITFHDPLAGVSVFDDSVCGFERGQVSVDPAGLTEWSSSAEAPHEVALSVRPERFFDEFFSVLTAG